MQCTICKAVVEEDGSNTNYCRECRGSSPKKLGEKYSERMEKDGAEEVNLNVFLPRKIYVRTIRSEKGSFDLIFSRNQFQYSPGEVFFTHGEYSLSQVFVIGSGFKIKFSDSAKDEPGLSDKKKKLNR